MLRPYATEDTEAIMSIWRLANQQSHPFLTVAFLASMQNVIQKLFIDLAETWVWEKDGVPVGFLSLLQDEISALYVLPEHQQQGVGRALLAYALQQRDTVKLDVFARNRSGHRFYERFGFVEVNRRFDQTSGHEIIRMCYTP